MGAFEEFKGQARQVLDTLREAYGLLQQSRAKTREARTRLLAATEGAVNPAVDVSAGRLATVEDALAEAAGHSVGGAGKFTAYLVEIGAGDCAGSPWARPGAGPSKPSRLEGFRPKAIHPGAALELAKAGWPRNVEGGVSARADIYDDRGTKLNGEPLTPYPYRGGPSRPELRPRFNDPAMATTWHVESKIAALIRERVNPSGPAAVYLNIRRCGAARPGDDRPAPLGCTENFRHVIPRDTVVYVHVVQENGRTMTQRVTGTGEGIR